MAKFTASFKCDACCPEREIRRSEFFGMKISVMNSWSGAVLAVPMMIFAQADVAMAQAEALPQPVSGRPACHEGYPVEAVRSGKMGSTTLLFHVTASGSVIGVIVAATSGSDILDSASVRCVKNWQFHPTIVNQQPVEAAYSASVEWVLDSPVWRVSLVLRKPLDNCAADDEAANQSSDDRNETTVVSYTLANGYVSKASVAKSSGNSVLDQKAIACVTAWHFEPETAYPNIVISGESHPRQHPPIDATAADVPRPASGIMWASFDWREFGAR